MSKSRKILFALVSLMAVLLLAIAVVRHFSEDQAFLKNLAGSYVLEATGRELSIDGALKLSLGSVTSLQAEDIHFANPDWASSPDMVRLGQLSLSVDFWSLFSGPLQFLDIDISNCQVMVEEDDQGKSNWNFSRNTVKDSKPKKARSGRGKLPSIDAAKLDQCTLTHIAHERDKPVLTEIDSLSLKKLRTGMYEVNAEGKVDTVAMTLTGDMGPFRSIWEGGPFEHDVKLRVGDIRLDSSGSFSDVKTGTGANIQIQFSGPEFAQVTKYLALPPFSSDAFDFRLHLTTQGELTALEVKGDLGSFDITANGEMDKLVQPYVGHLDMMAKGPDLRALGELFEIQGLVKDSFEIQLKTTLDKGQLTVSALALDTEQDHIKITGDAGSWPGFLGASIDFDLSAEDYGRWEPLLGHPERTAGPISAKGHVDSSEKGAVTMTAQVLQQGNRLDVNGSLGDLPKPVQPDLNFDLESDDFRQLGEIFNRTDFPVASFSAKGRATRNKQGIALENISLALAANTAELSGQLNLAEGFQGSKLQLQINVPSTEDLGNLLGFTTWSDQRLGISADVKPVGKGLEFSVGDGSLGDIQLKLDGQIPDLKSPKLFNADVDIRMPSLQLLSFLSPDIKLPDLPFAITGNVTNEKEVAQLSKLHLELGKSSANITGNLNFSNDRVGSTLNVSASGSDFRELVGAERWPSLPGDFNISGKWSRRADNEYLEDVHISLGDMLMDFSGTVDNVLKPTSGQLNVSTQVPDISIINEEFDLALRPEAFELTTDYAGSLTDFRLDNLAASLGKSHLTGDLIFKYGDDVKISGSLSSDFLDLTQWFEEERQDQTKSEDSKKSRVFGDGEVIKFDAKDADLDLDILVAKADLGNVMFEKINLGVLFTHNLLEVDPMDFMGQQGSHVDGRFSLDGRGTVPKLEISAHGADIRLGLLSYEGQDPSTFTPLDIQVDINGQGNTQHEMASTLDGKIRIYQGAGVIASSGVEFLFSDFITNLFSALNPFSKQSNETQLDCGVFAADITDGQVAVNPIVVQTREITILSGGTIDLVDEKIDLTFNTKPRTGIGISASAIINPFIKVGGTLTSPAIQLDAAKAVLNSGAAVATVGLSVLAKSFTNRFFSSRDPCGDARKKLEKSDGGKS